MTPKHVLNKDDSIPKDKAEEPEQQTVGDYMGQITSQLNQVIEGMPENQKAIFQDMFSGTIGQTGKVEVIRRNQRAHKQGYDVELFESMSNGKKVREFWVTDAKNIQDGELLVKTMRAMADLYREVMHAYAMPGRFIAMEFEDLDGKIPVVMHDYDARGKLNKITTLGSLTEVTTNDLDYDPRKKYQDYNWSSGLMFE